MMGSNRPASRNRRPFASSHRPAAAVVGAVVVLCLVCVLGLSAGRAAAGPPPKSAEQGGFQTVPGENGAPADPMQLDWHTQFRALAHAGVSLPLAAALGASLAFRPRRRGTPARSANVIQTQVILAIVGATVMLIVGASLARAFGIVGAASLVRYRAKIDDPKDAGVMLTTLGVGLASGVGLYLLAVFGTVFVLAVLWIIESLEPQPIKAFTLHVKTKHPADLRPDLERLLRQNQLSMELRTSSPEELCYEVFVPYDRHTDRLSNAILALDPDGEASVEWEEKKKVK